MVELVCIDLDGTLLNDNKVISEQDRKAIEKLQNSNIHVTIFTGRSFYSALPYVMQLGIQIPVVFQNGALICSSDGQRIFREVWLPSKIAQRVVEAGRQAGLYSVIYDSFFNSKDMYVEGIYEGAFKEYFELNLHRTNHVENLINFLESVESIVEVAIVGNAANVEEVVENLFEEFLGQFTPVKNREIDGTVFLEIFGKNVGKETALKFVLDLFHVSASNTMYIGDNYNDLEIMKKVGYAVAMGNAPEEIKKVASFVTLTNNDSGVAHAIQKLVIEKL